MSTPGPKCIGIWGRLFGHRFTVAVADMVYKTDYCGRCGMAPWRAKEESKR